MLLAVYLGGVACCWSFNNSVIDLLFFAVQPVVLSSYGGGGGDPSSVVRYFLQNQFTGRHVCRDVERAGG